MLNNILECINLFQSLEKTFLESCRSRSFESAKINFNEICKCDFLLWIRKEPNFCSAKKIFEKKNLFPLLNKSEDSIEGFIKSIVFEGICAETLKIYFEKSKVGSQFNPFNDVPHVIKANDLKKIKKHARALLSIMKKIKIFEDVVRQYCAMNFLEELYAMDKPPIYSIRTDHEKKYIGKNQFLILCEAYFYLVK